MGKRKLEALEDRGYYWSSACGNCALRTQCTTGKERRVRRWEHEEVLERLQARLDQKPRR
jgi:positive regulator of sigma E activity